MVRKTIAAALVAAAMLPAGAKAAEPASTDNSSTTELLNLTTDVRFDFQNVWHEDGGYDRSNSGFTAKYLIFKLNGTLTEGLTYSWRQRLNRPLLDGQVFEATDWLYLQYRRGPVYVSGGKEIVAIGGFEYDAYPVNLYGTSLFWANVPCFQLGATVGFDVSERTNLKFQVSQSPFHTKENRAMYAYNLMWTGNYGRYHAMWSANMLETTENHYINYIMLGNRLDFGPVTVSADLMNRYARHQAFFGKDMSIIGEVKWTLNPAWAIHAKWTYDVNKSDTDADQLVLAGTSQHMIGGGVEYFPLLKKRTSLRFHLNCYHSWGENTNTADVMRGKTTMLDLGVTWHMDLFHLRK